jgi:hypothetical protein
MDYSSMKKEDLIKILVEQRHLAEAVEAKDAEIHALRNRKDGNFEAVQKEKELLKIQHQKEKETFEIEKQTLKLQGEKESSVLKDQIRMLTDEVNKFQNKLGENKLSKDSQDKLVKKNEELVDFGNKYVKLHTNMIQSIQGILELSSDLEKTLLEKIQKSQKE